jgi:lipoyl(octanoyl) transferase
MWVCHLGLVPYLDALAVQQRVHARRLAGAIPDTLLLLEHPAVYTRGRRSGAEDLPFGEDFCRARGIDVIATDRGGKLTYHGPGQLVGYPIMAVADVGAHLRTIEDAIIDALSDEGVAARTRHDEGAGYTGVWVRERKIASIGVHVSRAISSHGFAVNVCNDLEPFSWVTACGLPDVRMTSIAAELHGSDPRHADYDSAPSGSADAARMPCVSCFRRRVAHSFCQAHSRRQRLVSPWRLGIDTTNAPPLNENGIPAPAGEPVPA